MFIFHKDTTLEDLGNGVTRRILAHDGKMMAVEVNFAAGAVGPISSPMCFPASLSSPSARRRASSAPAIRCISGRGLCTVASACSPARCSIPLLPFAKIFLKANP